MSGIVAFFALPPTYKAKATVALLPQNPLLSEIVPQLDPMAYREAFLSSPVMRSVIEKLNLDPRKYTVSSLQRNVTIEILSKENLLKLSVQDRDPTLATKIAESLLIATKDSLTEHLKRAAEERLKVLESMLSASHKELEQEVSWRMDLSNLGLRLKTQIGNDKYFVLHSRMTSYELDLAGTIAQKKDISHSLEELQKE